ncbi:meiotic nuclear division protein 1 [Rhizophagus irregularis]|uniref:Meiotic nuclear division protein 1 n=4 Tax=Rhizophagus irregularis TaxID=588596 RepID=A0A2I1EGL3_9GLOM|nr:meiotic nuclear division protein 1 [Rhizophagus irregularis DAOM 181602=DAOM 197198]EXX76811.1 Mnd1p [Rhizophagus irregularis DAOM 197198w]PKC09246.1 meiotic nuclear division protein 1 [Rhizophagus irregularis]RGB25872.1 meiotic nuclear division protein 1 [Rhizophagus diaphanus] [Rhizophagus sp. MUCL 43196]PKC74755.1 meiotic nuclear division protein 1 [Rhizophagus irregularis]PKY21259.1 meiotic nuclear division protein 1 [Rhizophagus irregularis]|eukprot:XP_025168051.1 meiotic nuclear division protein 1 [Rhizophagus irregularis DAOM 181602=DAOM 197198]
MSKKGLSLAEKRKRLEALFHETKEFYQLKELERDAPKMKGIVTNTVKDVLQSLVDDNLVNTDKIGTSNYYWSFPSSALQSRKARIEELMLELQKLKEKNAELQSNIDVAYDGRENSDDRATLLKKVAELEAINKKHQENLALFRECDPALLEAKENHANLALECGNRWTENIFLIQSYCFKKFNIERADFNQQFGIPEEFDTL